MVTRQGFRLVAARYSRMQLVQTVRNANAQQLTARGGGSLRQESRAGASAIEKHYGLCFFVEDLGVH